ncbi:methyltransferase domain-containing protein [Actinosynnema sp. CA-248983]
MVSTLDVADLERRVKEVYRAVAERPRERYHFEVGRALAERLGYPPDLLDHVPAEALESFAGVGYCLDLARPAPGDRVLDLGSGSGTDVFAAAHLVGPTGRVTGVDMSEAQLAKAGRLRTAAHVEFLAGHIEDPPVAPGTVDLVLSNGVVNLSADKAAVFRAAAAVLAPGGRLAICDIVAERPLAEHIVCDASLWAACVGGAAQVDEYRTLIEDAGLRIVAERDNPGYAFRSGAARAATATYGIKSTSFLAAKPR